MSSQHDEKRKIFLGNLLNARSRLVLYSKCSICPHLQIQKLKHRDENKHANDQKLFKS